jgi:hypothetical protein
VQRLKQVFNSIGASSEKIEPSVENLPGTFEHIEGEVDALDEVDALENLPGMVTSVPC